MKLHDVAMPGVIRRIVGELPSCVMHLLGRLARHDARARLPAA